MKNEKDEECAIRETYEETGICIPSLENSKKIHIGKNVYYFYELSGNVDNIFNIHDTNEVETVAWMSLEELKSLPCNKDLRAFIR